MATEGQTNERQEEHIAIVTYYAAVADGSGRVRCQGDANMNLGNRGGVSASIPDRLATMRCCKGCWFLIPPISST